VDLDGAVVVVTGASSGFGELTAIRFARAGSRVVVAARREERLESLVERIGASGGSALPVRCDVTSPAEIEELRDRVDEAFGHCDVLVNNAGIPGRGPLERMDAATIERVIRTNVLGVMLCTKAFLPMMLDRARGHIVNVASLAGRFATPGAAVYGASKHAVVAFSESLYYELRPKGVLVTSVNPGFSPTEGFPMTGMPGVVLLKPDRVARTIVDVVRKDRAPEVSIPRTLAAMQAFRVITPPLYRWGLRTVNGWFSRGRS
jgi:NAD(P)-dependent dehydrogenase (short-subunit alcohol dehydrogenase family)